LKIKKFSREILQQYEHAIRVSRLTELSGPLQKLGRALLKVSHGRPKGPEQLACVLLGHSVSFVARSFCPVADIPCANGQTAEDFGTLSASLTLTLSQRERKRKHNAEGWFETAVWIETRDAEHLEKQRLEVLSGIVQCLQR
jgi:hypothetical protein